MPDAPDAAGGLPPSRLEMRALALDAGLPAGPARLHFDQRDYTAARAACFAALPSVAHLVALCECDGAPTSWSRWADAARYAPMALLEHPAALEGILHNGTDGLLQCCERADCSPGLRHEILRTAVAALKRNRDTVAAIWARPVLHRAVEAGYLPPTSALWATLERYARYKPSRTTDSARQTAARLLVGRPDASPALLLEIATAFPREAAAVVAHPNADATVLRSVVSQEELHSGVIYTLARQPDLLSDPVVFDTLRATHAPAMVYELRRAMVSADGPRLVQQWVHLLRLDPTAAVGEIARAGASLRGQLTPAMLVPALTDTSSEVRSVAVLTLAEMASPHTLDTATLPGNDDQEAKAVQVRGPRGPRV
jgi:hypothetical protein